jgi:adenosylhomocysteine nucleosidase
VTRTGVLAPLPAEARALGVRRASPDSIRELGPDVIVCVSGIGPERARDGALALVERGADRLLSFGTAGALDPELRSGTIVIPDTVADASGARLATDAAWSARLAGHVSGALRCGGTLVESDVVVASSDDKRVLAERTGAIVVDMESAAVGAIAADSGGLPFAVLRVVADDAALAIPRAVRVGVDDYGRVRPLPFARALLARPTEWSALMRLATAFRRSAVVMRALRPAVTDTT